MDCISSVVGWDFCLPNNPKNLDPSEDGSRFLRLFLERKSHHIVEFHKTDFDIWGYSRKGKPVFYLGR